MQLAGIWCEGRTVTEGVVLGWVGANVGVVEGGWGSEG